MLVRYFLISVSAKVIMEIENALNVEYSYAVATWRTMLAR